jgi:hypothetical protein
VLFIPKQPRLTTWLCKPHHIFVKRTSYSKLYFRVYPFFVDLQQKHPRYALNKAMKNKVVPEPEPVKIATFNNVALSTKKTKIILVS